MIEDLQLVEKANWSSSQLSGGMKRKLRSEDQSLCMSFDIVRGVGMASFNYIYNI